MALAELVTQNDYTFSPGSTGGGRLRGQGGGKLVYVKEPSQDHLRYLEDADVMYLDGKSFRFVGQHCKRNSVSLAPLNAARAIIYSIALVAFCGLIFLLVSLAKELAFASVDKIWVDVSSAFLLFVIVAFTLNVARIIESKRQLFF